MADIFDCRLFPSPFGGGGAQQREVVLSQTGCPTSNFWLYDLPRQQTSDAGGAFRFGSSPSSVIFGVPSYYIDRDFGLCLTAPSVEFGLSESTSYQCPLDPTVTAKESLSVSKMPFIDGFAEFATYNRIYTEVINNTCYIMTGSGAGALVLPDCGWLTLADEFPNITNPSVSAGDRERSLIRLKEGALYFSVSPFFFWGGVRLERDSVYTAVMPRGVGARHVDPLPTGAPAFVTSETSAALWVDYTLAKSFSYPPTYGGHSYPASAMPPPTNPSPPPFNPEVVYINVPASNAIGVGYGALDRTDPNNPVLNVFSYFGSPCALYFGASYMMRAPEGRWSLAISYGVSERGQLKAVLTRTRLINGFYCATHQLYVEMGFGSGTPISSSTTDYFGLAIDEIKQSVSIGVLTTDTFAGLPNIVDIKLDVLENYFTPPASIDPANINASTDVVYEIFEFTGIPENFKIWLLVSVLPFKSTGQYQPALTYEGDIAFTTLGGNPYLCNIVANYNSLGLFTTLTPSHITSPVPTLPPLYVSQI